MDLSCQLFNSNATNLMSDVFSSTTPEIRCNFTQFLPTELLSAVREAHKAGYEDLKLFKQRDIFRWANQACYAEVQELLNSQPFIVFPPVNAYNKQRSITLLPTHTQPHSLTISVNNSFELCLMRLCLAKVLKHFTSVHTLKIFVDIIIHYQYQSPLIQSISDHFNSLTLLVILPENPEARFTFRVTDLAVYKLVYDGVFYASIR